jgi:hypothetical protein
MTRPCAPALAILLSAPLAAQALPDPKVLLPDGYELFVRADMVRIQQSEFWRVFSHTVFVKTFLEKQVPEHLGIDVEDLRRFQVGMLPRTGGRPESASVYLEGTKDIDPQQIAERAHQHRGVPPMVMVAGRRAWLLPEGDGGPSVTDMGPGMAWLASPESFVRSRLEAIQKTSPHRPPAALAPLLARDRGDLFVAFCGAEPLAAVNQQFAATSGTSATGLWLQVDFHPELVLRAGMSVADAARIDKAKDAAEQVIVKLADKAAEQGLALARSLARKIVLKAEGNELTTEIKVDRKDVATIAQGGLLMMFGATRTEVVVEKVIVVPAPEPAPVVPQSRPGENR